MQQPLWRANYNGPNLRVTFFFFSFFLLKHLFTQNIQTLHEYTAMFGFESTPPIKKKKKKSNSDTADNRGGDFKGVVAE